MLNISEAASGKILCLSCTVFYNSRRKINFTSHLEIMLFRSQIIIKLCIVLYCSVLPCTFWHTSDFSHCFCLVTCCSSLFYLIFQLHCVLLFFVFFIITWIYLSCSMFFCFALFWSVLPFFALCCSLLLFVALCWSVLLCVALCCSVLLCVALFCSLLLCVALFFSVLLCLALYCSILLCVALCCFALLYFALCCSVLLYFALCCFALLFIVLYCFVLLYVALSCFVFLCFALWCYLSPFTSFDQSFKRCTPKVHLLIDVISDTESEPVMRRSNSSTSLDNSCINAVRYWCVFRFLSGIFDYLTLFDMSLFDILQ